MNAKLHDVFESMRVLNLVRESRDGLTDIEKLRAVRAFNLLFDSAAANQALGAERLAVDSQIKEAISKTAAHASLYGAPAMIVIGRYEAEVLNWGTEQYRGLPLTVEPAWQHLCICKGAETLKSEAELTKR